jgi:hypothetical protein
LFDIIFSTRFQKLLDRNESNIFMLLACGSISNHEEPKLEMKNFADKYVIVCYIMILIYMSKPCFKRGLFSKIICFEQSDFQPSLAHSFVMDIALTNFIYDRLGLDSILRQHQELGAHTNVIEFQRGKVSTFRWTHPGARPMGEDIAGQCCECNRLKTTSPKVSQDKNTIIIKCTFCKFEKAFNFPPDWTWVSGPPLKGDERGAWLVRVDEVRDINAMDTT